MCELGVARVGLHGIYEDALRPPALHIAAARGDVLAVLKLLVAGANPNEEDSVLGESPLFEAAAADSAEVVFLLLLFGADPRRRGRHTTSIAHGFAPVGGAAEELLGAIEKGDGKLFRNLGLAAMDGIGRVVVQACSHDPHSVSTREAFSLDARLRHHGHEGILDTIFPQVAGTTTPGMICDQNFQLAGVQCRRGTYLPLDVTELHLYIARKQSAATLASRISTRLQGRDNANGAAEAATTLGLCRTTLALIAAFIPAEALSVFPAVAAGHFLDASEDLVWWLALGYLGLMRTQNSRRIALTGEPVSWRETFQELMSQQLYTWGIDGTVTGHGARAPMQSYMRPTPMHVYDKQGMEGTSPEQSRVHSIACGWRHSAVLTVSRDCYAWGRDVALKSQSPAAERTVVAALGIRRRMAAGLASRRANFGEPRLISAGADGTLATRSSSSRSSSSTSFEEEPREEQESSQPAERNACHLSKTLRITVLRLTDERAADMQQLLEMQRARFLPPGLPPLQKICKGCCFFAALSCDGRIYIWRHGGLVPTGITERVPTVPTTMLPSGEVAVDIAVGVGHVVVLVETGHVWTWGWHHPSALGRGPRLPLCDAAVPGLVEGLERVVQVGAGGSYSFCLDADGVLWLFGEGPTVAGCFREPEAVLRPRAIPSAMFGSRRVLAAACGEGHILVHTAWDPCKRLQQHGAWFGGRGLGSVSASSSEPPH
mmetsp:Transcript_29749/g.68494  ORF Transcript_29749/g.68494 Transcript_29749/m.68494 type:complete len:716 (+) Transcript_29749:96-2243(+)